MNTQIRPKQVNRTKQDANLPIFSVCVIDLSDSMTKPDFWPSRLAAAIESCSAYVKDKSRQKPNDYIAVVQFSEKAKVVCPLLHAGSQANKILESLQGLTSESSTDFCTGLKKANKLLSPKSGLLNYILSSLSEELTDTLPPERASRHVLFLSDGDHNHRSNPVEMAARMKNDGIVIDCIGIGSRDEVNETLLRRIASVGDNGEPRYRFFGDKGALLQEFRRIATLRIV